MTITSGFDTKEMAWLEPRSANTEQQNLIPGEKVLHLGIYENGRRIWKPYWTFPQYAIIPEPMQDMSRGYATMQKLLVAGWQVVTV
jgi:hypothetical protein